MASSVLKSQIAAFLKAAKVEMVIPEGRGFTVADIMATAGVGRCAASDMIRKAQRNGKVVHIGRRGARHVYEMAK